MTIPIESYFDNIYYNPHIITYGNQFPKYIDKELTVCVVVVGEAIGEEDVVFVEFANYPSYKLIICPLRHYLFCLVTHNLNKFIILSLFLNTLYTISIYNKFIKLNK